MTKTLVTFLLDRSGSMDKCRDETIEAFNVYLNTLQSSREDIDFTFLLFDSQSLDRVCVMQPIARVRGLDRDNYIPRGYTPLIDASYKTIKATETSVAEKGYDKVVICIQTDGEENQSREYTWKMLKELVTEKTAAGWQFNFIGAGIDAYAQGAKMGVAANSTMSYDPSSRVKTMRAFGAAGQNTVDWVGSAASNTSFSDQQRVEAGDRFVPALLDLTTPQEQR